MTSFKICLVAIFLTIFYLLASVLFSNIFLFKQSNGSLIKLEKKIIGSKLIGQNFINPSYFHPRPSISNYKNDISGNSNFPFYSTALKENISANYTHAKNTNHNEPDLNLITGSASGLDPHITYNGALTQIERISQSSTISKEDLIKILNKTAKRRILGIFGEKIVNVLELNLKINNTRNYSGLSL